MPVPVTPAITLGDDELGETFVRASGPGGQNVNKVSTAVRLTFHVWNSPALPGAVKTRLARLAGRRLGADGVLTIAANLYRSQDRNRQDALDRLVALIREAAIPPTPRIPTRTPRAQRRHRVEAKVLRGATKRLRATPPRD